MIDPDLLAKQEFLTAKIQDFQKRVKTHIKQKYARNHKVIIFKPDNIITFFISKED